MEAFLTPAQCEVAAETVWARTAVQPRVGLILGSGLNTLAEAVQDGVTIPYKEIPYFPAPSVAGHIGRLVVGHLEGQAIAVLQGRAHYYEGYSMAQVTFPVRVLQHLGIEILIVTNAAGGLNPAFRVGDVMMIADHINLVGMAGLSPLRGPNWDAFGPRFPDMSQAYDSQLRAFAREAALEAGFVLHEGVYICLAGPNYETPADLRFLRLIGADAVGMSTVPEVIVARHGGTRVLGLSGISNVLPTAGETATETTHEEVLAAGAKLAPRIEAIVRGVLRRL